MEQNSNVEHEVPQNKQPEALPITQKASKEKLTFLKKSGQFNSIKLQTIN